MSINSFELNQVRITVPAPRYPLSLSLSLNRRDSHDVNTYKLLDQVRIERNTMILQWDITITTILLDLVRIEREGKKLIL